MSLTVLITGFGPFPGAPFNPTEPLALELARRPHPAFANVRRLAHVFRVSYEAVDRDLPALLASERPDALIMFGLAVRAKHVRIETRARNSLTRALPDASGRLPLSGTILAGGPAALPLRTPAQRLLMAARARPAGCALARCRPLPLQLSLLARRRDRPRQRAAGDLLHSCTCRSPHAHSLAAPATLLAR